MVVCPDLSRPDQGLDPLRLYPLSAYGALLATGSDDALAAMERHFSLIPSKAARSEAAAHLFIDSFLQQIDDKQSLALIWIVGINAYSVTTSPDSMAVNGDEHEARVITTRRIFRGDLLSITSGGHTLASAILSDGPVRRVTAQPSHQVQEQPCDSSLMSEHEMEDISPSEDDGNADHTPENISRKSKRSNKLVWLIFSAVILLAIFAGILSRCGSSIDEQDFDASPADTLSVPVSTAAGKTQVETSDTANTRISDIAADRSGETGTDNVSKSVSESAPRNSSSASVDRQEITSGSAASNAPEERPSHGTNFAIEPGTADED